MACISNRGKQKTPITCLFYIGCETGTWLLPDSRDGAFWWWFAFLIFLGGHGVLDLTHAGSTIAVTLIGWGVFTFYMWIATFRLSKALWWIFLTLWITFMLLGFGDLFVMPSVSRLGGYVGLTCGLLAMYTSFALVTNSTFGKTVIPVGASSGE